jgi:hypothetical protein
MDDIIVWTIIIGFYAPLHYIPPILMILFKTPEDQRKKALTGAIIDCSLSMGLAFMLVYLVGMDNMLTAMAILLMALFLPYIRVIRVAMKNP